MGDILVFDDNGMAIYDNEHFHRQIVSGDIASVRARMVAALEHLDYHVIDESETAIKGRRDARGGGSSYTSADILDYPGSVAIRFKDRGANATVITFDYIVKHPSITRGDKDVLTREAEALAALASVSGRERICNSCGNRSIDDSRFCRQCGSPIIVEHPELELLHMSRHIRAAQQSIYGTAAAFLAGLVVVGIAIAVLLSSDVTLTKGIKVLMVLAPVILAVGLWFSVAGVLRVNRTLKRKEKERDAFAPTKAKAELAMPAPLFTAQQEMHSVVDNTTTLLPAEPDPNKTGEFSTDREIGR